jgi:UDP:flavonoid glycosyltransferase YjiC (YdhE family)
LVTQDTAEKDSTKLFEPTLEALINSEYLVVVATGGSDTDKLRQQYAAPNIIIEDFIPFADIMPYADVYVTNGGMSGMLLSIENKLPIVAAGIQEGKNEVGATVSYFNLGVNLKTERPAPEQIRKSVDEVTSHLIYHNNVEALSREVAQYNPLELSTQYIQQLLLQKTETCKVEQFEKVFTMNQCENRVFATLILR